MPLNNGNGAPKLSRRARRRMHRLAKAYDITDEGGEAILEAMWSAWDLWQEAQAVVDREGLTVPGDRGGCKAHPLTATIRDARSQYLLALKMLNLDLEPIKAVGRPPGR